MHLFHLVSLFVITLMIGVELCVSLFINPIIFQLDPEPRDRALSLFASLLGKVMPFWYGVCFLLLATETWLYRHTPAFPQLALASAIWLGLILMSVLVLVPINNRIAARSSADLQQQHRRWDTIHRFRVFALCVAAALFMNVVLQ